MLAAVRFSAISLLVVAMICQPGVAAAAERLPGAAVEPFEPSRVRLLESPFKQLQELHRTGFVGSLEPDRLLFEYRKTAQLPQPPGVSAGYGGWDSGFVAGHYAGHYLSAASRMYAATGDDSFRNKAVAMVDVLAECQARLGGGYLAAFPSSKFDVVENTPARASVPYYTVHKILAGLLDVYALCGHRKALDVAQRMSDYFAARIVKLSPAQLDAMLRTDYTGNPANEFGGMAESLADLFVLAKAAGQPDAERHLKLAAVFQRDWFVDPLVRGEDRLSGLHGNTHIAQAVGLARYAVVTADDRAFKAAENFWKFVTNDHSFVNGGNSFDEKLRAPRVETAGKGDSALTPETAESCNTHNMLKLSRHLFQRDPRREFADYIEHALWNHILTTIAPDSGLMVYSTPLRPGDFRTYLDSPYCCVGTGIENTARFGDAIYFHRDDTLWINLYIPSALDWREQGLRLRQESQFPVENRVLFTIEAEQPTRATLKLRVPPWCAQPPSVKHNGSPRTADIEKGYIVLSDTWTSGDRIELTLPATPRLRRSMDDPRMVSVFYGPILLAGELGREGMPESDVAGNQTFTKIAAYPVPVFVSETPDDLSTWLRPVAGAGLAFTATGVRPADGSRQTVRLAPFYQVHHQRYAVYWRLLKPDELKELVGNQ